MVSFKNNIPVASAVCGAVYAWDESQVKFTVLVTPGQKGQIYYFFNFVVRRYQTLTARGIRPLATPRDYRPLPLRCRSITSCFASPLWLFTISRGAVNKISRVPWQHVKAVGHTLANDY
ncbi:hypothetical protein PoB_004679400 [Plakobranchus ocellatus]|uniref:Uncharacterized protein n=1 Tax=Plakobranchus ocellatus TaxID=259542 RepID=A0AAV4BN31_9GAST|nr:hypothetical protein PoB_004679400 [Plakobranchus ocellatus]